MLDPNIGRSNFAGVQGDAVHQLFFGTASGGIADVATYESAYSGYGGLAVAHCTGMCDNSQAFPALQVVSVNDWSTPVLYQGTGPNPQGPITFLKTFHLRHHLARDDRGRVFGRTGYDAGVATSTPLYHIAYNALQLPWPGFPSNLVSPARALRMYDYAVDKPSAAQTQPFGVSAQSGLGLTLNGGFLVPNADVDDASATSVPDVRLIYGYWSPITLFSNTSPVSIGQLTSTGFTPPQGVHVLMPYSVGVNLSVDNLGNIVGPPPTSTSWVPQTSRSTRGSTILRETNSDPRETCRL